VYRWRPGPRRDLRAGFLSTQPAALDGLGAVFDHVAVAGPRLRDLLPLYQDILGGRYAFGADTPRVGFRFLQLGYPNGARIELMEPLAGSTFFDSFFRRVGPAGGLHHITFKVPDIETAIAMLDARGYSLTGVHLAEPAWREAFLHPKQANGVLVQIAQGGDSPPGADSTIEDLLAGNGAGGNGVPSP